LILKKELLIEKMFRFKLDFKYDSQYYRLGSFSFKGELSKVFTD